MELNWEVAAAIVGIVGILGGAAVKWITGSISIESVSRQRDIAVLEKKLDEDTKALEQKIDHKHRNVEQGFVGVHRKLDQNCDKLEVAAKDIVRLSEAQKSQDLQVREIKTEMKEALHDLRQNLDARLDKMSTTQQQHFDMLAQSIREIRKVEPKS